jgi:hypothetical protein
MPEKSELQLVFRLLEKTQQNEIDWQPTALAGQLTASFAGKYTVLLTRMFGGLVYLKVKNADGDELADLMSSEEPRIETLYKLAASHIRKEIDDQLDDLTRELDNPSPAETRSDRARLIQKIKESKAQEK